MPAGAKRRGSRSVTFEDLYRQQVVRGEILAEAPVPQVRAVAHEDLETRGHVHLEAAPPLVTAAVTVRMPPTTVRVESAAPQVAIEAGVWVRAASRQEQEALWLLGLSE